MFIIKSIRSRTIYNSHAKPTNEFVITFDDGTIGVGASPQGETTSIYEDNKVTVMPEIIIKKINDDGWVGKPITQESFDDYLQQHFTAFGRNNAYGVSEAFFNASVQMQSLFSLFAKPVAKLAPPCICCNILNGGLYAYTNPVLSDFSEYMLVSRTNNIAEIIACHNEIQHVVKEKLLGQPKVVVSGNIVNRFATADNREVIEFLLDIVEGLKLSHMFDLMIDASAGDLLKDDRYCLAITDKVVRSSEAFYEYWMDIIKQYNLRFLEDPFGEKDYDSWQHLTTSQQMCYVIGDNLYSSSTARIEDGAAKKYAHGAVIKPNQAGTVTAVREAIETAQRTGQIVITSHRSISTESVFLSALTCMFGVKYSKIGPLETDYSSVVRLNEIIRLTEDSHDY